MLPIFVVNLDRDHERRERVTNLLRAHGLEASFRSAVDGAELEPTLVAEVYDSTRNHSIFKRPLSRPEIGCYLSHFALWTEIASSEAPGAIVLEDDIEAGPGLKAVLERISLLDLGASVVKLYAPSLGMRWVRELLPYSHKLVAPWIAPACTTGYVISREAAQKLADQALPFARPVDLDLKHWWEFGICVLAVTPSLVVPANCGDSTIEPERSKTAAQFTQFQRFVRNLKYQARFHARLVRASIRRRKAKATSSSSRAAAEHLSSLQAR